MLEKNKLFFGWYVAAACFFISFMAIGARYSYGVFLKPLELEFGISRASASGLFSIYMLLCSAIAAIGGWALDRLGPRKMGLWMAAVTGLGFLITSRVTAPWQLLISYSLLLSLGTGTVYTVANSTASRWFIQKRGLAVGITSSGGGVGMVVLAPLAAFLISRSDWRIAFLAMGIIVWLGMAVSALWLIKDPQSAGLFPDGSPTQTDAGPSHLSGSPKGGAETDLTLRQAIGMKAFWLLGLVWLSLSLTLHMVFVHIVPYALDMGIDAIDAAFIISLMGLSNIPGRLVVGKLSDRVGRNTLGTGCFSLQFVVLLWLMWANQLWMLYVFALIFGFLWGGGSTIMTALIGDIFGVRNLGVIMGIMSAAWAFGAALGPGIAGIIFDISGRYLVAFGVCALTLLIAAFSMYFARSSSDHNLSLSKSHIIQ